MDKDETDGHLVRIYAGLASAELGIKMVMDGRMGLEKYAADTRETVLAILWRLDQISPRQKEKQDDRKGTV